MATCTYYTLVCLSKVAEEHSEASKEILRLMATDGDCSTIPAIATTNSKDQANNAAQAEQPKPLEEPQDAAHASQTAEASKQPALAESKGLEHGQHPEATAIRTSPNSIAEAPQEQQHAGPKTPEEPQDAAHASQTAEASKQQALAESKGLEQGQQPEATAVSTYPNSIAKAPQEQQSAMKQVAVTSTASAAEAPQPPQEPQDAAHASQTAEASKQQALAESKGLEQGQQPEAKAVSTYPNSIAKAPQEQQSAIKQVAVTSTASAAEAPQPPQEPQDAAHASQTAEASKQQALAESKGLEHGQHPEATAIRTSPNSIAEAPQEQQHAGPKTPEEPQDAAHASQTAEASKQPALAESKGLEQGQQPEAKAVSTYPNSIAKAPQEQQSPIKQVAVTSTASAAEAPQPPQEPQDAAHASQTAEASKQQALAESKGLEQGQQPEATAVRTYPNSIAKAPQEQQSAMKQVAVTSTASAAEAPQPPQEPQDAAHASQTAEASKQQALAESKGLEHGQRPEATAIRTSPNSIAEAPQEQQHAGPKTSEEPQDAAHASHTANASKQAALAECTGLEQGQTLAAEAKNGAPTSRTKARTNQQRAKPAVDRFSKVWPDAQKDGVPFATPEKRSKATARRSKQTTIAFPAVKQVKDESPLTLDSSSHCSTVKVEKVESSCGGSGGLGKLCIGSKHAKHRSKPQYTLPRQQGRSKLSEVNELSRRKTKAALTRALSELSHMHGQKRRRLSGDTEGERALAEVKAALAKACEEEDSNTSPGSTGPTANSAKKPRQAPQEPQPPQEPQDAAHASQAAEASKQPALAESKGLEQGQQPEAEANNAGPNVTRLFLQECEFEKFLKEPSSMRVLLRTYKLPGLPRTVHILTSTQNGGYATYVGKIEFGDCSKVTKFVDIRPFLADGRHKKFWSDKVSCGDPVYAWHITKVTAVGKVNVRFYSTKHRYKHFDWPRKYLSTSLDVTAPQASLYSSNTFFMRLLSPADYDRLRDTANALNGYKIRLGTTCSGTDIAVVAVESVLRAINTEFNVARL